MPALLPVSLQASPARANGTHAGQAAVRLSDVRACLSREVPAAPPPAAEDGPLRLRRVPRPGLSLGLGQSVSVQVEVTVPPAPGPAAADGTRSRIADGALCLQVTGAGGTFPRVRTGHTSAPCAPPPSSAPATSRTTFGRTRGRSPGAVRSAASASRASHCAVTTGARHTA